MSESEEVRWHLIKILLDAFPKLAEKTYTYLREKKAKLDNVDRAILSILMENARISYIDLSRLLAEQGIKITDRGAAQRIKSLERKGVIQGYAPIINYAELGMLVLDLEGPEINIKSLEEVLEILPKQEEQEAKWRIILMRS